MSIAGLSTFGLTVLALLASFGGRNSPATLADLLWVGAIVCFVVVTKRGKN